ncbi:MAG: N-acetylmuramoyl-L-alanine amidase [Pseudomonadota bacterium]
MLAAVLLMLLTASTATADSRDQYLQAESCYRKLRESPSRQKYRDQWMRCINGFEAVHSDEPDGGWAAAGLYMAGTLYLELARRSFLTSDRQEGLDRLQRIVKRHPDSAYRPKAEAAIAATASDKPSIKEQTRRLDPKSAELSRIQAALAVLTKDAAKRRYRHNWQKLIDASLAVYHRDPDGPAGAGALYTTGRLYHEMAAISRLSADRREAADYYARVIRHFPTSAYAVEAETQAARLLKSAGAAPTTAAPAASPSEAAKTASIRYTRAESARRNLMAHPSHQKYRDKWQNIIDAYLSATAADPDGELAAAGLYQAGSLYLDLYKHSYRDSDQSSGIQILERVVRDFPDSRYREEAKKTLAAAAPERLDDKSSATAPVDPLKDVIAAVAASATADAAPEKNAPSGIATVSGLRYWSNPRYTRVVIDADQEAAFTHRLLNEDPSQDKPHRLFVDLEGCRLGADMARIIPINDDLLSDARAGQNTSDTVRVVIDIKSFRNYKIFSLKNPFRVVIDVWGEETAPPATATAAKPVPGKKLPVGALVKQLALGVQRIVIDPGHGGKDYGAPGYAKGVHEKTIVLSLAKQLAEMIRTEIGCEVVLTRTGDTFLPLEERTAFANTRNADLFISIHTNAARDNRAYGIETYFLNLATDDDAIRVAALENATSTKNISDLQAILSDLMQNAKINESSRLANHVHDNITQGLKKHYNKIKSKGVKQAPFYVLLGAQMPAVLVETSFISNPRECQRLTDAAYQKRLCHGIVTGIKAYIEEANPSAFHKDRGAGNAGKG